MDEAQLRGALDRFMTSLTLREAQDVVRGAPELLGNDVWAWLEESLRRFRQQNNDEYVAAIEHWLGLLRVYRRFGAEEGYWELLADQLARAGHDETKRLLVDYPELASDSAREYFERRERESHLTADQSAAAKYQMASSIPMVRLAEGDLEIDTGFVGEFLASYVSQDDETLRHQYLLDHPEVLQMPAARIAESLFQPSMNQAWADVDVVTLRNLYLRRAMFRRAQQVGAAEAVRECEEGAEWPDLITT